MKESFILLTTLFFCTIPLFAQEPTEVFTGISFPYDLEFKDDNLYVSEAGSPGGIYVGNITTTPSTDVSEVTLFSTPKRMVFNNNDLYVPQEWEGNIFKIDISSNDPIQTLILSGLDKPIGIALKGNDLYFSQEGANKISKIDITDDIPTIIDVITGVYVHTIAFNGNDLYFCGLDISKIDVTESDPTVITVLSDVVPDYSGKIDLVFNGDYLYFSHEDKISKIDLTASSPTRIGIATGINALFGLTIKDNDIYYTSDLGGGVGSIFKIDINTTLSAPAISSHTPEIKLFPNPANEFIQLSGIIHGKIYSIYNTIGSLIKTGIILENDRIDIKDLPSELYFLKFEDGNTLKFIKE